MSALSDSQVKEIRAGRKLFHSELKKNKERFSEASTLIKIAIGTISNISKLPNYVFDRKEHMWTGHFDCQGRPSIQRPAGDYTEKKIKGYNQLTFTKIILELFQKTYPEIHKDLRPFLLYKLSKGTFVKAFGKLENDRFLSNEEKDLKQKK